MCWVCFTKNLEIMKTKTKVELNCPKCKTRLDVDELLVSQFEDSIRKDLQSELKKREEELLEQRKEYLLMWKHRNLE